MTDPCGEGMSSYRIGPGDTPNSIALAFGLDVAIVRDLWDQTAQVYDSLTGVTICLPIDIPMSYADSAMFPVSEPRPLSIQEQALLDELRRRSDELLSLINYADSLYVAAAVALPDAPADRIARYSWLMTSGYYNPPPGEDIETSFRNAEAQYKWAAFSELALFVQENPFLNPEAFAPGVAALFEMGLDPVQTSREQWDRLLEQVDPALLADALQSSYDAEMGDLTRFSDEELLEAGVPLGDYVNIRQLASYGDYIALDETVNEAQAEVARLLEGWNWNTEAAQLTQLYTVASQIPDSVLGVPTAYIREKFLSFHDFMRTRAAILLDLQKAQTEVETGLLSEEESQRRALRQARIAYLWETSGGFRAEWADLDEGQMGALGAWYMLNNPDATGLARGAPDDALRAREEEIFGPYDPQLGLLFFLLGFIPVVNVAVDFADTLISLSTGDLFGALVNLLPFDEIIGGLRRVFRNGDEITRSSGKIVQVYSGELSKLDEQINRIEAQYERIRTARPTSEMYVGESLRARRGWFASKSLLDTGVARPWRYTTIEPTSRLPNWFDREANTEGGRGGRPGKLTVGNREPVNYAFRGQNYQIVDPELSTNYPDGVDFTNEGFPIFDHYVKMHNGVKLQHTFPKRLSAGSYDMVQIETYFAKQQVNGVSLNPHFDPNDRSTWLSSQLNGTWHHVEDGHTLQLVPEDLHKAVKHTGGEAVIRDVKRRAKYKLSKG